MNGTNTIIIFKLNREPRLDARGPLRIEDITDSEDEMMTRKRTKKEQLAAQAAKKRRVSHAVKLVDCNCKRKCFTRLSKDERSDENTFF